jgi:hypothetical protein
VARRVLILIVLLAVLAPAASARDPGLERLRLKPADTALAQRIAIKAADLGSGWHAGVSQPEQIVPRCPGYQPDFSRLTLTGRALTTFESRAAQSTVSANVEVYASRSDALGEWKLSVTPPAVRCFAELVRQIVGIAGLSVASARVEPAPDLAEASARFEIVLEAKQQAGTMQIFIDGLFLRQGRTIAALYTTALAKPVPGLERLGRRVAARM